MKSITLNSIAVYPPRLACYTAKMQPITLNYFKLASILDELL